MGRCGQVVALSLAHLNVRKWKMLSGAHSVLWWGLSRLCCSILTRPHIIGNQKFGALFKAAASSIDTVSAVGSRRYGMAPRT